MSKERRLEGGRGMLARFLPITVWLPGYDRAWIKGDLTAGLSVGAVVVPTSMGFATISGVPVQHGLYAAALGLIAFALFTNSKQVTQGPASSSSAALGAAVLAVAPAGSDQAVAMAAAIVVVSGLLYIIMSLLRMGWISEFLSASVLTGFTFGVGINVAIGQLCKITGTGSLHGNGWQQLWAWFAGLPETHVPTLAVGGAALVLMFGCKLLLPRVPGALVTVVLAIGATPLLGLGDRGVELIPDVPHGLPGLVLPSPGFIMDNLALIVGAAAGLLLIGFSVTTAVMREYANKHNYSIDINQELLAQGMANLATGLGQGIFTNASLSRSPLNEEAGARSQISNLAQALLIILTLMYLAPMFSLLPWAVLGAILIEAVVMGMMNVKEMRRLYRVKPVEFMAALGALLGVLTFGVLQGLAIGVAISIIWLVAVCARPAIPELGRKPGSISYVDLQGHPDSETCPGLKILRFDGGLFFVNADAFGDRLRDIRVHGKGELHGLVLSMEGVDFIDIEGADRLARVARVGMELGIDLYLARVKPQVMRVLEKDGVVDLLGAGHFHDEILTAVLMHVEKYPEDAPSWDLSKVKYLLAAARGSDTSNAG